MFLGKSLCDSIVLFLIILIIIYYIRFYRYWHRKQVPCLQAVFSHSNEHLGIKLKTIYKIMKQKHYKHSGVFLQLTPVLVVADLEQIKHILVRDFDFFPHRGLYYNEKDPLSCHIFNAHGPKWKNMRLNLQKLFTGKKLKEMGILQLCEQSIVGKITENSDIDCGKMVKKYVSEIIELCVFGTHSRSFEELAQRFFERSRVRRFKGFIVDNFPRFARFLSVSLIPQNVSNFFLQVVEKSIEFGRNNGVKSGFLELLTQLKNENGSYWSLQQVTAQCFIFFLAGMSTSPSVIAFALYELAKNEKIQHKLREEINKDSNLEEIRYLDQVVNETMRKYPPAAYLNRKCAKNYRIPKTEIIIDKGTTVTIPVLGLHHDEHFFPDPEAFKPDRFSRKIPKFAYLPFGEGPRICLGMRFGLLQTKVALFSLVKNYEICISPKTTEPLEMLANRLVLTPKGGIWLKFKKITNNN